MLVVPRPVKPPDDGDAVLWAEGDALPTCQADVERLRARWLKPRFSRHMPLPEEVLTPLPHEPQIGVIEQVVP